MFSKIIPSSADANEPRKQKWGALITGMPNTIQKVKYYLIIPSWCGSTNIPHCVEIKHLYQCRIHPNHYSRRPGKCIECLEEWDRRERASREADRVRKMEKKARDAGDVEFTKTGKGKFAETLTKPGKMRQTLVPKVERGTKQGRWPKPSKHEEPRPEAEKAPELEQDRDDGQERGKNKGKTHGLTLYKAKKKWRD